MYLLPTAPLRPPSLSRRLEDDFARHYFDQLLDAVEHCHARGVCHRDIKVGNEMDDFLPAKTAATSMALCSFIYFSVHLFWPSPPSSPLPVRCGAVRTRVSVYSRCTYTLRCMFSVQQAGYVDVPAGGSHSKNYLPVQFLGRIYYYTSVVSNKALALLITQRAAFVY